VDESEQLRARQRVENRFQNCLAATHAGQPVMDHRHPPRHRFFFGAGAFGVEASGYSSSAAHLSQM
jgi:hypothetical protein